MVRELYQRLVTLLERIRNKHDSIELWVIIDHGTSYMRRYTLSSAQDLGALTEVLSTLDVMIYEEDLQKLRRAGLAHLLYESVESDELYTPQQLEFSFKTMHNAEEA